MIDFTKVVSITSIHGYDEEDTRLLNKMCHDAHDYLSLQPLVGEIKNSHYGLGTGGVVAVFLMEIEALGESIDPYLWVIVGDLPPAFLSAHGVSNPARALSAYMDSMQKWVDAVRMGHSVDNLISVNIEPTKENAELLAQRLEFIDSEVLFEYVADLEIQ